MKLRYELPEPYALELRGRLMDREIKYCIPYDLSAQMKYVAGYVVVVEDELFILESELPQTHPDSISDDTRFRISIESYKLNPSMSFEMREYNSSGSLEMIHSAEPSGDESIVFFTLDHVARFASLAQILTNMVQNEPVYFSASAFDDTKCPKCGKPYMQQTKYCSSCSSRSGTIMRMLSLAKPFWPYYLLIFILFWINSGIMLYQPIVSKNLITNIIDPATRMPFDKNMLIFYTAILTLLSLSQSAARVLSSVFTAIASSKLTSTLRTMIHNKIQSLSVNYIEARKTGELMHRVTRDSERIQNFIDNIFLTGVNELLMLFTVTITLFAINWKLALVVLAPSPFMYAIFKIWRNVWKFYHVQWRKFDRLNSFLNDILRGIKVVKAFGQEDQAVERFKNDAAMLRDITITNEKRFFTIMPVTNFLFGLGGQFVLLYCGNKVLDGSMTIGQIVQLSAYASYFYQRVEYLVALPRWINEAVVNAQRIFEVMDAEPASKQAEPETADISGDMKFDKVTFGYLSYKNVLKNIDLDVKQGEMIGLVGHSGAGKSTMINLIMRMFEPQSGKILIDGKNINLLARESYQHQLGVVLQETFLFSGSVLENIRYTKPDASVEDVIKMAIIANAHDFILNFPMGYDSRVGENGQRLSGGERQRIAIARAVLVNPKILILDEATASVDTETEKQIQDALTRVVKGRTTFAIAHRLSTLKNADRIVVLEQGKIIEMGGHKELIELKGKYYQLVMAQKMMSAIRGVE